MSEFSESIHIYNDTIENVKKILEELEISSVILGRNNKTITVIMSHEDKKKIYSRFDVLDYIYGEDHGIRISVYSHSYKNDICIEMNWDIPVDMGLNQEAPPSLVFSPDFGKKLAEKNIILIENISIFENIIKSNRSDWGDEESLVEKLSKILGLYSYSWLSFDYFLSDEDSYQYDNSELIKICL